MLYARIRLSTIFKPKQKGRPGAALTLSRVTRRSAADACLRGFGSGGCCRCCRLTRRRGARHRLLIVGRALMIGAGDRRPGRSQERNHRQAAYELPHEEPSNKKGGLYAWGDGLSTHQALNGRPPLASP